MLGYGKKSKSLTAGALVTIFLLELLAGVFTLQLAPPAYATGPTLVQSNSTTCATTVSPTSCTLAFTTTPTTGDALVALVFHYGASSISTTYVVSDSVSSDFNQVGPEFSASGFAFATVAYATYYASGVADTVTFVETGSTTGTMGVVLQEWSGIPAPLNVVFDGGTCNSGCTGALAVSPSRSFSASPFVAIAIVAGPTSATFTAGAGFTLNKVGATWASEYSTTVTSPTTFSFTASAAPTYWSEMGVILYTGVTSGSTAIQVAGTTATGSVGGAASGTTCKVNGLYMLVDYESSSYVYRTSANGTTWSAPTTITTSGTPVNGGISVGCSGTTVYYADLGANAGHAIYYRYGTAPSTVGGAITWTIAETAITLAGTVTNSATTPTPIDIQPDGAGNLFISATTSASSAYQVEIYKCAGSGACTQTSPIRTSISSASCLLAPGTGSSFTCNLSVTAGDVLIVIAGCLKASGTCGAITVSDSQINTFNPITSIDTTNCAATGNNCHTNAWSVSSVKTTGTDTFTIGDSGVTSVILGANIYDLQGATATGIVSSTGTGTGTSNPTSLSVNSYTPPASSITLAGAMASSGATWTAGGGYTLITGQPNTAYGDYFGGETALTSMPVTAPMSLAVKAGFAEISVSVPLTSSTVWMQSNLITGGRGRYYMQLLSLASATNRMAVTYEGAASPSNIYVETYSGTTWSTEVSSTNTYLVQSAGNSGPRPSSVSLCASCSADTVDVAAMYGASPYDQYLLSFQYGGSSFTETDLAAVVPSFPTGGTGSNIALATDGASTLVYIDPAGGTSSLYATVSTDGGSTWSGGYYVAYIPSGTLVLPVPTVYSGGSVGIAFVSNASPYPMYYSVVTIPSTSSPVLAYNAGTGSVSKFSTCYANNRDWIFFLSGSNYYAVSSPDGIKGWTAPVTLFSTTYGGVASFACSGNLVVWADGYQTGTYPTTDAHYAYWGFFTLGSDGTVTTGQAPTNFCSTGPGVGSGPLGISVGVSSTGAVYYVGIGTCGSAYTKPSIASGSWTSLPGLSGDYANIWVPLTNGKMGYIDPGWPSPAVIYVQVYTPGTGWGALVAMPGGGVYSGAAATANGDTIAVTATTNAAGGNVVYDTFSGGAWGSVSTIVSGLGRTPLATIQGSGGANMYVAFGSGATNVLGLLSVSMTNDGGASWSAPMTVSTLNGENSIGSMNSAEFMVGNGGYELGAIWTDTSGLRFFPFYNSQNQPILVNVANSAPATTVSLTGCGTSASLSTGSVATPSLPVGCAMSIANTNIIQNYVSITATNAQSSATPSPFQLSLLFSPSAYSQYLTSDLGNIRFYSSTTFTQANELYAWNENGTSSSNSHAQFWVKLPNGISAQSSTTIYMVFGPTATDYDGNYWGASPGVTSTAGLDNGANVFLFYDAANLNYWTSSGQQSVTGSAPAGSPFGTSAIKAIGGVTPYAYISIPAQSTSMIIESYVYPGSSSIAVAEGFLLSSSGSGNRASEGSGSNTYGISSQTAWNTYTNAPQSGSWYGQWVQMGIVVNAGSATEYTLATPGTIGSEIGSNPSNTFSVANSGTYFEITVTSGSTNYFNGIVVRALPPSGVMPSTSYGVLKYGSTSGYVFSGSGTSANPYSFTVCGLGSCPQVTATDYWELVSNFTVSAAAQPVLDAGLSVPITGEQAGTASQTLCSILTTATVTSLCRGQSDYNIAATMPANFGVLAGYLKWENAANGASTVTPTSGGQVFTTTYYKVLNMTYIDTPKAQTTWDPALSGGNPVGSYLGNSNYNICPLALSGGVVQCSGFVNYNSTDSLNAISGAPTNARWYPGATTSWTELTGGTTHSINWYKQLQSTWQFYPQSPTTFSGSIIFSMSDTYLGANSVCSLQIPASPAAGPYTVTCWNDDNSPVVFPPGASNNPFGGTWYVVNGQTVSYTLTSGTGSTVAATVNYYEVVVAASCTDPPAPGMAESITTSSLPLTLWGVVALVAALTYAASDKRRRAGISTYIEVFILIAVTLVGAVLIYDAVGQYQSSANAPSLIVNNAQIKQGTSMAIETMVVTTTGKASISSITISTGSPLVGPTGTFYVSISPQSGGSSITYTCSVTATTSVVSTTFTSGTIGPGQTYILTVTIRGGTAFTIGQDYTMIVSTPNGAQATQQVVALGA